MDNLPFPAIPFVPLTTQDAEQLIARRAGETKLGEALHVAEGEDWLDNLNAHPAGIVILGIPEDIGVRANYGIGGVRTLWPAFLKALLNVQNDPMLRAENVLVAGAFDCSALYKHLQDCDDTELLRNAVAAIDEAVWPLIRKISETGKTPVIIGGGHNNAYPIMKGCSLALGKPLGVVNIDPHTDFRQPEGRHSGNGFRYAFDEGLLARYAVPFLHRNYNNPAILKELEGQPDHFYAAFFDGLLLDVQKAITSRMYAVQRHLDKLPVGVEIDLDSIPGVLASAATPTGLSMEDVRKALILLCVLPDRPPVYLHICEGAAVLDDGRADPLAGKRVAYFVTDFLRAVSGNK